MELTHGFPSHRSAPKMRGRHPGASPFYIINAFMKYDETCTYLLITSAFETSISRDGNTLNQHRIKADDEGLSALSFMRLEDSASQRRQSPGPIGWISQGNHHVFQQDSLYHHGILPDKIHH